jgi:predicted dinucleotide-binding enzyme
VNIGIIGAGAVGTGLTKHLLAKGHSVILSFSRDEAKLRILAADLGAFAGGVSDTVQFGEVVVLGDTLDGGGGCD